MAWRREGGRTFLGQLLRVFAWCRGATQRSQLPSNGFCPPFAALWGGLEVLMLQHAVIVAHALLLSSCESGSSKSFCSAQRRLAVGMSLEVEERLYDPSLWRLSMLTFGRSSVTECATLGCDLALV
eukprot:2825829-Amphidinium_carterae.1